MIKLFLNRSLQEVLPELDPELFPKMEEVTTINTGERGEHVIAMQEALVSLGYMEGEADGAYGQGTSTAVKLFQAIMIWRKPELLTITPVCFFRV